VRQPVRGILDIDDDALLSLHQYTAGNPFFAKLVCGRMFDLMVDQRDTHVTSREMEDAFHSVLEGDYVSSNTFQHFWEDGILDVPERVEEHSLNRRRLLLGFAAMMRDRSPATREALLGAARRQGLGPADAEGVLRDLERRDIVELSGNVFLPTVPFFAAWLEDEGLHAIVNTLMDPDAAERLRSEEERAYIHPTEIVGLVASWGHYRGRALTEDRIRAWLDQFGDQHQRRLVFSLLEGIDFFSRSRIGAHLSEAHEVVRRRIKYSIDTKRRKQGEFLISYLGGPGKSGATYARLYANENKIYKDNVVEPNRVVRRLQGDGEVQAVVYVDDFLGTGDTLLDSLPEIKSELGERLEKGDLSLYFIFVSGFERARDRLNRAATEVGMPFQVFMAEPLADIARAFDPGNTLFDSEADREEARRLAQRFGERLEKKIPLGYGDDQALVVFEDSIPNNSLPILWSQSRDFEPLFPRV
jgi:hypothetical protein